MWHARPRVCSVAGSLLSPTLRRSEQVLYRNVFINKGPVNPDAAANQFPLFPLRWRRILQARKPTQGHGQFATIHHGIVKLNVTDFLVGSEGFVIVRSEKMQ